MTGPLPRSSARRVTSRRSQPAATFSPPSAGTRGRARRRSTGRGRAGFGVGTLHSRTVVDLIFVTAPSGPSPPSLPSPAPSSPRTYADAPTTAERHPRANCLLPRRRTRPSLRKGLSPGASLGCSAATIGNASRPGTCGGAPVLVSRNARPLSRAYPTAKPRRPGAERPRRDREHSVSLRPFAAPAPNESDGSALRTMRVARRQNSDADELRLGVDVA